MASQRRIGWLFGLLIALILIAYASGTFNAAPSTVDVPDVAIDASEIDGIEIHRSDFSITAERVNGIWQLTEPVSWLADSSSVRSFARSVADLTLESVVSMNPERYGRYGVDSTGSDVVLSAGGEPLHLIVSSEGPDFSTTYVRLDDDERVFVGRPRISLPTDVNRWRDRTVTSIPEALIQSVSVVSPGESYSVERMESGWLFIQDGETVPADSAGMANFLKTYAQLRADGFLADDVVSDSLVHRVDFQLAGGESRRFTISELENELAVQFSGETRAVFRFFTSRRTGLVPGAQTLRQSN